MSSRNTKKSHYPIAATALGILAVATGLALGLAGWPVASAQAAPAPEGQVVLGVVASTAVVLGPEVPLAEKFSEPTSAAVATVSALATSATKRVVTTTASKSTARPLAMHRAFEQHPRKRGRGSWRRARVSWYGPGLYGNGMAGGGKLRRNSMVVAHRSLPFGTRILFRYKGRSVVAIVRDRGPFISGRKFDLGPGTAKALHFDGVGTVKYRIIRRK